MGYEASGDAGFDNSFDKMCSPLLFMHTLADCSGCILWSDWVCSCWWAEDQGAEPQEVVEGEEDSNHHSHSQFYCSSINLHNALYYYIKLRKIMIKMRNFNAWFNMHVIIDYSMMWSIRGIPRPWYYCNTIVWFLTVRSHSGSELAMQTRCVAYKSADLGGSTSIPANWHGQVVFTGWT